MKFYFYPNNSTKGRRITKAEALEHISEESIKEAMEDHMSDPLEQQSFFVGNGIIEIEF